MMFYNKGRHTLSTGSVMDAHSARAKHARAGHVDCNVLTATEYMKHNTQYHVCKLVPNKMSLPNNDVSSKWIHTFPDQYGRYMYENNSITKILVKHSIT